MLGAREGRFSKSGETKSLVPFAASSIPLVTLGTFLLWFGWFGFNGFSQLAMGTFDDVNAISKIAVNTHLAGAAGTVAAAVVTRLLGGKTDIVMMLNGALAEHVLHPPGAEAQDQEKGEHFDDDRANSLAHQEKHETPVIG